MPKALRRFLLALFVVAMQGVAQAVDIESPRTSHDVEGVRWTDWLVQVRTDNCVEAFHAKSLPEKCGDFSIRVKNDTRERLQCRMTLELSGPNEYGEVHVERDLMIEAGSWTEVRSRGPLKSVPASFNSECWKLPSEVSPLTAEPHCPVETTLDNPDDFYPPGPIRRRESGEAIIEFTAAAGSSRVKDIRLVQATGFPDLDNAALKLARAIKVRAQCGAQRVRRSVLFDISTDPRDQPESLGCLVYSPPAMVLVTDPGSK